MSTYTIYNHSNLNSSEPLNRYDGIDEAVDPIQYVLTPKWAHEQKL